MPGRSVASPRAAPWTVSKATFCPGPGVRRRLAAPGAGAWNSNNSNGFTRSRGGRPHFPRFWGRRQPVNAASSDRSAPRLKIIVKSLFRGAFQGLFPCRWLVVLVMPGNGQKQAFSRRSLGVRFVRRSGFALASFRCSLVVRWLRWRGFRQAPASSQAGAIHRRPTPPGRGPTPVDPGATRKGRDSTRAGCRGRCCFSFLLLVFVEVA